VSAPGESAPGDYRVDLAPIERVLDQYGTWFDALRELQERRERMASVRSELLSLSRSTEHPSRVRQRLGELAEELLACGPVMLARPSAMAEGDVIVGLLSGKGAKGASQPFVMPGRVPVPEGYVQQEDRDSEFITYHPQERP
jgi:hypothetical protein